MHPMRPPARCPTPPPPPPDAPAISGAHLLLLPAPRAQFLLLDLVVLGRAAQLLEHRRSLLAPAHDRREHAPAPLLVSVLGLPLILRIALAQRSAGGSASPTSWRG